MQITFLFMLRQSSIFIGFMLAILALVQPAYAQSSQATSGTLEEIVVTAQKRNENLQDVALSITAFTDEELKASGIQDTWDLMLRTPGMALSTNGANAHLYLRGVGSDILGVGNEPSSAIYLDGVYLGRSQNAVTTLLDTERIEVLRGPQGTLYGRNVVGGALMLYSKRPTDEFEAEGSLEFGNFDTIRFKGAMGGSLVPDKVNARVAILKADRDGFVDNINPAASIAKLQDEDRIGVRASIQTFFTPNFDLLVSADYLRDESSGPPSKVFTPGLANTVGGAVLIPDLFTVNMDSDNVREIENWGIHATATWDAGPVIAKTLVAYRTNFWDLFIDSDGTEVSQQDVAWNEDQEQVSVEFQLLSDSDGPLEWVAGFYYFWEDSQSTATIIQPTNGIRFDLPSENLTNAYAGFGQASYWITEKIKLTAGVRYSWEEKVHLVDFLFNGAPFLSNPGKESWDAWTPTFGIDYKLNDDILLYFKATRGFKSGGFNSVGVAGEQFDPEIIWAYEIGMKSQWLDNRLQLNTGAFYYDYTNLQVTRWTQTFTAVENAAQAEIFGGEIEVTALPVSDLELTVGIALLDATYKGYVTADPAQLALGPVDLSGNTLRDAPEFTASIVAQYTWPIRFGSLTLHGEYQYQSEIFFNPFNEDEVKQSGFDTAGARLSFDSNDGRWGVAVFGRNIFDDEYKTTVFRFDSTGFNTLGNVGQPRTFGIELTARY